VHAETFHLRLIEHAGRQLAIALCELLGRAGEKRRRAHVAGEVAEVARKRNASGDGVTVSGAFNGLSAVAALGDCQTDFL